MPKYPAFLAARFETRGVPCVVDGVEDLSPRFRRLHLSGEGLRGHEWAPCQVTSFRVSDTEFRHYTPDGYDPERGRMSILFYRHGATAGENEANGAGEHAGTDGTGNGHRGGPPGQRWLTELGRGDEARPMVPGATRRFRATGESGTYWVFGDGTTVGLWYSLIRWLPAGSTVRGAVELPAAEVGLGRELLPGIDVLPEDERPGVALEGWLDAADRADGAAPDHVYLSGHAQTIQRLRSTLRGRFGVDKGVIRTHAYWATGRTGL